MERDAWETRQVCQSALAPTDPLLQKTLEPAGRSPLEAVLPDGDACTHTAMCSCASRQEVVTHVLVIGVGTEIP